MNSPLAPPSISARVSTVSFSVFPLICIGIDNEFDSILAVLTLKMSRQGETDVEAVLLFKNPVLPILSKIHLSLHHSYLSTDFKCVDGVLFHYISLSVFVSMCWLDQDNLFQDVLLFHSQSTILSACIQHVFRASFNQYPCVWVLFGKGKASRIVVCFLLFFLWSIFLFTLPPIIRGFLFVLGSSSHDSLHSVELVVGFLCPFIMSFYSVKRELKG